MFQMLSFPPQEPHFNVLKLLPSQNKPSLHLHTCHLFSFHFTARNLNIYWLPFFITCLPLNPLLHAPRLASCLKSMWHCWLTIASFMENALLFSLILFFCRLTLLCPVIQCTYSSRLSSHSLFSLWTVSSRPTASNSIYVSVIFSILLPVQTCPLSSRSTCQTSYSKLGSSNLTHLSPPN